MEKILNLLNPGKSQDDETLYGSGSGDPTATSTNTHHTGGLTGEGTHFGSSKDTSGLTGQQSTGIANTQDSGTHSSTTTGPHSSNLANKADPRVDSDNSKLAGSTGGYTGSSDRDHGLGTGGGGGLGQREHQQYAADTSTGNTSGLGNTQGAGTHLTTTAGPHWSNLSNKVDPRVDSDNSKAAGSGIAGTTGGYGNTHGAGTHSATTDGPHSSDLANKVDPRVDSDNSNAVGSGVSGTAGGYNSTSGGSYHTGPSGSAVSSGPHQSETANRLDPSVNTRSTGTEDAHHHDATHGGGAEEADHHHRGDAAAAGLGGAGAAGLASHEYNKPETHSDRGLGNNSNVGHSTSGQDQYSTSSMPGSYPGGPGPAPTTAGPHKYDILNKLDPRVNANPETSASGGEYKSGPALNPTQSGVQTQAGGFSEPGHSTISGIPEHTRADHGPHSSAVENRADPTRDQYNDNTSKDHHYGRDAALAGGAAGVAGAAYGAGRHEGNDNTQGATSGSLSGSNQSRDTTTAGPHSSNLANRADPTVDSDRSKDYGRDATVIGGVGSAGHGTSRGHDNTATSTDGPYSSNIVNKADPTVDSDRSKDHSYGRDAALAGGAGGLAYGASRQRGDHDNTTAGPHDSNLANRADPRVDSERSKEAGGVGGAIHGTSRQAQSQGVTTTTTTNTSSSTYGPHSSNLANKADPRVDSDQSKDHNYGRDAALVGGTGAGAYGANKHRQDRETTGPHSSDIANKADPTIDSDRSKDHHYGRDAAVVGGAGGAAAYGAHKYNERDEKDIKKAEKEHEHELKEAEKDRKHAERQAEKERKHTEKEHEKIEKKEHKGGLLSFLHRDKSKKYSKEEEDEFDRQEREQESHKGRDATLGASAGAAVGGGAYAAHQHESGHNTTDINKPLPTAPGNHGIGTGEGTQNALASDSTTRHGHHSTTSPTGHHGPTAEAEKPPGTTIGDKLHGVERNRGVPGPTGYPDETPGEHNTDQHGNLIGGSTSGQHSGLGSGDHSTTTRQHDGSTSGLGLGAGSGAGALGANEHRKHQVETAASGNQHGSGHIGSDNSRGHHTGRDAALVGGVAGAGALGSHEYGKHGFTTSGQQSGVPTGRQYDNTQGSGVGYGQQSGLTGQQYDNKIPQGAGLVSSQYQDSSRTTGASGGNDYRQPGSGQTSGLGSSGYDDSSRQAGGLTGGSQSNDSSNTTGSNNGRNRLHKDPPSSHPASKLGSSGDRGDAHVPASGIERQHIVGQGEENLGDDTGIKNSHAEDSARNY